MCSIAITDYNHYCSYSDVHHSFIDVHRFTHFYNKLDLRVLAIDGVIVAIKCNLLSNKYLYFIGCCSLAIDDLALDKYDHSYSTPPE